MSKYLTNLHIISCKIVTNDSFIAAYDCQKVECLKNDSYIMDVDWGYYIESNGKLKLDCALSCRKDNNCGTFEWTEQHCIWWKQGMCQFNKTSNTEFTGTAATCKKLGLFELLNC